MREARCQAIFFDYPDRVSGCLVLFSLFSLVSLRETGRQGSFGKPPAVP